MRAGLRAQMGADGAQGEEAEHGDQDDDATDCRCRIGLLVCFHRKSSAQGCLFTASLHNHHMIAGCARALDVCPRKELVTSRDTVPQQGGSWNTALTAGPNES